MSLRPFTIVALAALLSIGCQGGIAVFSTPGNGGQGPGGSDPDDTYENNIAQPDPGCEGVECEMATPSPTPALVRLTHAQWENSARDVLLLTERPGLSSSFQEDTNPPGFFDRDATNLSVTPGLWDDYREAAEALADQVTADRATLDRITPEGAPSEDRARAEAIVSSIARRAYRRALTGEELAAHMVAYDEAAMLADDADPHLLGVRQALALVLQSPYFLYRVETTLAEGEQGVRLSGTEIATRLSYALLDTTPSEALLARAEAGELDTREGVAKVARELLDDERARPMLLDFYDQLLHMSSYEDLERTSVGGPDFSPAIGRAMGREIELFVLDIIETREQGLRELLTSTTGFVNRDLVGVYDLEGDFGEEYVQVDLGEKRPGFLTRSGPMAYMAIENQPAPIKRGHFVLVHLTCTDVPPAPNEVEGDEFVGATNRDRWQAMTGECGAICHSAYLNPAGFAFENYDAMGRWQEMESGQTIDASGEFSQGSPNQDVVTFEDAADVMSALAESKRAHACHARHWFEYIAGRIPGESEEPLIAQIARASMDDDLSVKETIVAIVTSDAFINRRAPAAD